MTHCAPLDLARFRPGVICKIVRLDEADDYLRLGWASTNALAGTHHGLWSVLMEWQCGCAMRVPIMERPSLAHGKTRSEQGGAAA